jgi:hypothetical protein
MLGYKYPNITSGATPIGSSGRAPEENEDIKKIEGNFESIIGVNTRIIDSSITPIRRSVQDAPKEINKVLDKRTDRRFQPMHQRNKAIDIKFSFSDRIRRDKMFGYYVRKENDGKILGMVLCDLALAQAAFCKIIPYQ